MKFLPFSSLSMVEDTASKYAGSDISSERSDYIPLGSWVPNWKISRQVHRLNATESTFFASKGGPPASVTYDNTELSIMTFPGCIVDRITDIASYLPPRRPWDKYNTGGANSIVWLEWKELADEGSRNRYKTKQDRFTTSPIRSKRCYRD